MVPKSQEARGVEGHELNKIRKQVKLLSFLRRISYNQWPKPFPTDAVSRAENKVRTKIGLFFSSIDGERSTPRLMVPGNDEKWGSYCLVGCGRQLRFGADRGP